MLLKQFFSHRKTVWLCLPALLVLAGSAWAEDTEYTVVDIYARATPRHLEALRDHGELEERDRCFPYGCGGISGPFRNPWGRWPEDLTACIYGINGTLLYERENKVCPYEYVDENQFRVERRRLEVLGRK
jgi:hypothetical protein